MSRRDDSVSVRQMLDAARKIAEFTRGTSRDQLDSDEKLALAVVRLLEVLGEAARRVSPEFRERAPEIPWREIVGTRDRLIHGYDDVNLDIVWTIVARELPALILVLTRLAASKP